ncbi:MAG: 2-C-methyl-D-erythritol 2,4-cyclodiphosphate synthase [Rhodothermia bacterium]|nr:2-C-methyl-D-erythritol 2,4-cyclodiphosphate synthase [Rhodothermia bacterium]
MDDPGTRIGYGYDVHRMESGRPLVLGGVLVPFDKGPSGHSDADVLLHAITDAILGAAALGDIGSHFPDNDPAYKNADSRKLLATVMGLVREREYAVGNVDATVVLEQPRLASYIPRMRSNIAEDLGVDVGRVSVKATTSETMGFVGDGRGIVAHAVCLLYRKGGERGDG